MSRRTVLLVTMATVAVTLPQLAHGFCTTTVGGGTLTGETWTLAGSPYCVDGDILVNSLTVEPGVRVQFLGEHELYVVGTLTAVGTAAQPILFRKDTSNPTGWDGLVFDYADPASEMVYCNVENALDTGVKIINTLLTVEHCGFSNNEGVNGGGMFIDLSTATGQLTLRETVVTSNNATAHGGGIYANISAGSLLMVGCQVMNNTANIADEVRESIGGAIYFESAAGGVTVTRGIQQCIVSGNQSYSRCVDYHCHVYGRAGGVYLGGGTLTFSSCHISGNNAYANAAGSSDSGYSYGGGLYLAGGSLTVVNGILDSNHVESINGYHQNTERGGGVYLQAGTANLLNSDLVHNSEHGVYRESGVFTADNSIIYFNSGNQIEGDATLSYCNIQGGWATGTGNIDVPPAFVNAPTDYHLLETSQCVNAGNNYVADLPPTDMDGNPRILDGVVDLGPYELVLPIFSDGFELGDTSAWSDVVP